MKHKTIEIKPFNGRKEIKVQLARQFRTLHNRPKDWKYMFDVTIQNSNALELNGVAHIYYSTRNGRYYITTYIDSLRGYQYAETLGIDWYCLQ